MQNPNSLNLINYSENLSAYYKCDTSSTNSDRNYSISNFRCSEDSSEVERIFKIEYTCKNCEEWHVKVSSNLHKFIIYGENQYANLVSHIDIISLVKGLASEVLHDNRTSRNLSLLQPKDLFLVDLSAKKLYFRFPNQPQKENSYIRIDFSDTAPQEPLNEQAQTNSENVQFNDEFVCQLQRNHETQAQTHNKKPKFKFNVIALVLGSAALIAFLVGIGIWYALKPANTAAGAAVGQVEHEVPPVDEVIIENENGEFYMFNN